MFSSSSRSARTAAADGTHAVNCYMCGETISMTTAGISRAVCALCQHGIDTGTLLPEEFVNQYKMSKQGVQDVSLIVVKEEKKIMDAASSAAKFTLRSMGGGNLLSAVGFKKKERPVKPRKTLELTDMKARQPLFSSMEEIDQQLKSNK